MFTRFYHRVIDLFITDPMTKHKKEYQKAAKVNYSWSTPPILTTKSFSHVDMDIVRQFYKKAPTNLYPMLSTIGQLESQLGREFDESSSSSFLLTNTTWFYEYSQILTYLVQTIHRDVMSDKWIPALEYVFTDPNYASTINYLTTIVNDATINHRLHKRMLDTSAPLSKTWHAHLLKLQQLNETLSTIAEQIDDDYVTAKSTPLINQTQSTLHTLIEESGDQWLLHLINQKQQ